MLDFQVGNRYIGLTNPSNLAFMTRVLHSILLAGFCTFLAVSGCYSQENDELTNAIGIGASFGSSVARTDINESKDSPFGRAFLRFYPASQVALEASIGLGVLQADDGVSYFNSVIYPVDVRLLIQPLKVGKLAPVFYGGIGFMYFNPTDRNDQPLLRNSRNEYGHTSSYFPVGGGFQYTLSENTLIGLTGTYNVVNTDNIDDTKSGGNDSYWSVTLNLFAFLKAANNDPDGDKLVNEDERQIGTDPLNPDTDGEGLKDGEEVYTYKTNPLNADTDGDGLNDREEIFAYKTDPLKRDTDNDGLVDGDEVQTHKTDPLKIDTDGEGLGDGDEVLKYRTDPLRPDTDGESLTDADEVLTHKTDPLKPDTDGDGLSDVDEVKKHKTNPLVVDTDAGGMPDGKEIQLSLNPLDPSDDVPIINVGERIILEGVNFETGKTTLLPGAKKILDQVGQSLLTYPNVEVAIHGHTDNVGGAKYNMKLSQGRAEAVKAYLVGQGIPAARITTRGYGFTKPIGDNATPDGRAKNRRIEFIRLK